MAVYLNFNYSTNMNNNSDQIHPKFRAMHDFDENVNNEGDERDFLLNEDIRLTGNHVSKMNSEKAISER